MGKSKQVIGKNIANFNLLQRAESTIKNVKSIAK
jgi:hypothetical protein